MNLTSCTPYRLLGAQANRRVLADSAGLTAGMQFRAVLRCYVRSMPNRRRKSIPGLFPLSESNCRKTRDGKRKTGACAPVMAERKSTLT